MDMDKKCWDWAKAKLLKAFWKKKKVTIKYLKGQLYKGVYAKVE